jgi:ATP-dependent HslUV protease, peptidase subunit HslV
MDSSNTHGLAPWHGTTILSIRHGNNVVIAGDGQVTMGQSIILKTNANKVRRLLDGKVIVGFAGATADAMTLFERLETKLEQYPSQLKRACVELAKDWRTDKYLRKLEALMAVVDKESSLILTGNGDVLEPEDGVIGIGSGGAYALAAARGILRNCPDMPLPEMAKKAMTIASEICVFTSDKFIIESL